MPVFLGHTVTQTFALSIRYFFSLFIEFHEHNIKCLQILAFVGKIVKYSVWRANNDQWMKSLHYLWFILTSFIECGVTLPIQCFEFIARHFQLNQMNIGHAFPANLRIFYILPDCSLFLIVHRCSMFIHKCIWLAVFP